MQRKTSWDLRRGHCPLPRNYFRFWVWKWRLLVHSGCLPTRRGGGHGPSRPPWIRQWMRRSWNRAACGRRIDMCGYTSVPEDGRTCCNAGSFLCIGRTVQKPSCCRLSPTKTLGSYHRDRHRHSGCGSCCTSADRWRPEPSTLPSSTSSTATWPPETASSDTSWPSRSATSACRATSTASTTTRYIWTGYFTARQYVCFITGPPTQSVGGQISNDRGRLSSSVVVCLRRLSLSSVTLQVGLQAAAGRWCHASSSLIIAHGCAAGQSCYVQSGRHLVKL